VAFALHNKDAVTLSFWPSDVTATMPLSILTLGTLFLGVLLGGAASWLSSLKCRIQLRKLKKKLVEFEQPKDVK
jgi:uncharacterized integral membrane protein